MKDERESAGSLAEQGHRGFDRELQVLLWLAAGAVLLYVLMAGGLFGLLGFSSVQSLDVRFGYSGVTAGEVLTELGEFGRGEYLIFHIMDYLFALALYPSLALLIRRQIRLARLTSTSRVFALLPLIAGVGDLTENLIIDFSILSFPGLSHGWLGVAGGFTVVKFLFLLLSILSLLVLGIIRVSRWGSRGSQGD